MPLHGLTPVLYKVMTTMNSLPAFLGDIPTQWSRIFVAQKSQGDLPQSARHDLLIRYHQAIQAFLRKQLPDHNAADALYSNFAVRVLEVDTFLKRADPGRGRFRDYLKAILRRMVIDHHRGNQRQVKKVKELIEGDCAEPIIEDSSTPEEDKRFLDCWRQEIINLAWQALEVVEKNTGQPYGTLLKIHEQQPNLRSAQLAEEVAKKSGKPMTAVNIRKLIQRGRELFGKLLIEEVARSLKEDDAAPLTRDRLEAELIELGLLFSYCKTALENWNP